MFSKSSKNNPLIITVAGVGAELTKKKTPYLPASPEEIVADAKSVSAIGAHVYHLHVRDSKGKPASSPGLIRSIVSKIKKSTNLIVQISTGGAIGDSDKQRLGSLVKSVDMGSLTLGSINFGNEIFENRVSLIKKLAIKMTRKMIVPEMEIFDLAMVDQAYKLIKENHIKPPFHFNIILGGQGWLSATKENLKMIVNRLPKKSSWSASGVGRFQKIMIEQAIKDGGHVRTGLEDNIYIRKGVLAKGNKELVEQVLKLALKHGRRIATSSEARKILGIKNIK